MNHATAREAHELRMQVGERLGEVGAQSVSLVGVFGHERHHVNVHVALCQHQYLQGCILAVGIGRQHGFVLFPVAGSHLHGGFG